MKTLPSLLTSFTCATLLATGHAQQPDDAVDIKQFDSKLAKDTTVLPTSGHTPSLPDARPRSDRSRCGGRESKFLAVGGAR
jgi:hypothetical protein